MTKLSQIAFEAQRLLGHMGESRQLVLQQDLTGLCESHWSELRGAEPGTPLAYALWSIAPPLADLFADLYTAGDARLNDVLRGHRPALDYLLALDDIPACSEITRVELMRGIRHGERDAVEQLMPSLRWIPVDPQIARRAGALGRAWRRSHALASADLVIGATAQELSAGLATTNVRHFPMFERLTPPY